MQGMLTRIHFMYSVSLCGERPNGWDSLTRRPMGAHQKLIARQGGGVCGETCRQRRVTGIVWMRV